MIILLDDAYFSIYPKLEDAYFSMHSKLRIVESDNVTRIDMDALGNQDRCSLASTNSAVGSKDFEIEDMHEAFFMASASSWYSKFVVHGVLGNGDLLNSANFICSSGLIIMRSILLF